MKFVKAGSQPFSPLETSQIKEKAENSASNPRSGMGVLRRITDKAAYLEKIMSFIDGTDIAGLKLLANCGNGSAGPILERLTKKLDIELISIQAKPDSTFPNGVPNPLDPQKREDTISEIKKRDVDFGVAFDGDCDRCFFFDEVGNFIEGYYIVGLIARAMLAQKPKSKIVYDNRLTWATEEAVISAGGTPIINRTGHTHIKAAMRQADAIYGGEMSAHHYFRDFFYCDSGIIPFLLVAQLVKTSGRTLGELCADAIAQFPCSGEINFDIESKDEAISKIIAYFAKDEPKLSNIDGTSADFGNWRFNIKCSNTEPLLRLNVESRGDSSLVKQKLEEITGILNNLKETRDFR